ncbi:MAG TPA: hypothetical protein DDW50_22730 [Firmicutes bacterium]|nr:hypothetical protein [Bacillota bacterium]
MNPTEYVARIAALKKENRILKQKLIRSETNRALLEEALETHLNALKVRNNELEKSHQLLRLSEAQYRALALHDSLTDLPNRIMFQRRLARAIGHAKKHNSYLAILYIDLDRFKPVNDNWGHKAGDLVLCEIAIRLKACVQGKNTIARIGGDEFAGLIEDLQKPDDAGPMAKRILRTITKPIPLRGQFCTIGASIGISCYPFDGRDPNLLLMHADSAMYTIKKSSRNGYRFYRELKQASPGPPRT